MKVAIAVLANAPSFARQDARILQEGNQITLTRLLANPLRFLIAVANSDVTLCWFADVHAAIAVGILRVLRKKSILILGGFDVARIPELHYGAFASSPIAGLAARYAIMHADRVLAVDLSLAADAAKNAGVNASRIRYLPTGYDPEFWKPNPLRPRERIVVSVASVDVTTIRLKGLDTLVQAARLVPEARFMIAGKTTSGALRSLKAHCTDNVMFLGLLSQERLRDLFQSASVICQPSLHEGLPNALCEAMLCGCIPVGTRIGGIPTAIGHLGTYVPYGDAEATAAAIRGALAGDDHLRSMVRERIITLFRLSNREQGLRGCIEDLTRG